MACRGLHLALTREQVVTLLSLRPDEVRLAYVTDELEEHFFRNDPDRKAETDKTWDAMHRALTDGRLRYDNGTYPQNHVIMGGRLLYSADNYIMSLKTPEQVRDVYAAISSMSKGEMRAGYDTIDPEDYGIPVSDEDFESTWAWFCGLRHFWQKAAAESRYVLFTVDQ